MKKDQRGLIEAYLLFIGILVPVFVAGLVIFGSVLKVQHTSAYSSAVMHGALNAAARELKEDQLAQGLLVVDMPRAQARFDEVVLKFKSAESKLGITNDNRGGTARLSIKPVEFVGKGSTTPSKHPMTTFNDSLFVEASYDLTFKLPFTGELKIKTIELSAVEGVRGINVFQNAPLF